MAEWTRIVHEEDPAAKVGGNLAGFVIYPKTCKPDDVAAADQLLHRLNDAYGDVFCRRSYSPWFLNRFPKALVDKIVLPEDRQTLAQAEPDFLSLTYYHSSVAGAIPEESLARPSNPHMTYSDFPRNADPYGFQHLLEHLWQTYQMPLLVTGNGRCAFDIRDADDSIRDDYRIQYLFRHICHMGKAMENSAQIIGYLVWSAIDLIASDGSLAKRSGLVHVDERTFQRRRKKSFYWYQRLCATGNVEFADNGFNVWQPPL